MPSGFYYQHTTYPLFGSQSSSALERSEFDRVQAGFDKLPTPTGYANYLVKINSAETGLAASNVLLTDAGVMTVPSGFTVTAGPVSLTGASVTVATAASGDNTTTAASTAYAMNMTGATLTSPALAGTPTAPTAAAGTSSTQIANCAFVAAAAFSSNTSLPGQTGNGGNILSTDGSIASWGPGAFVGRNNNAVVSLPVSTAASTLQHRVTIDANRELLFFYSTTAVQAVCYDNSTKTFGNAVLVRTATNARLGALLIGTDKVLVGSCPDSSTAFEAVVLTLTGLVITVNTAVPATLPETLSPGVGNLYRIPVAAGSSYVFAMKLASSARLLAVTVSGTVPTVGGTALSLVASSVIPSIRAIDATHVLAVFIGGGNLTATPITVSAGTTLTPGTAATSTATAFRYLSALSTGRWAVVFTNTNCIGGIISVSGTVASISVVTLNAAADGAQGSVVKIGDQLVVQCSVTVVNVLTDAAGTATAGTSITVPTLSATAACGYGSDYAAFGGSSIYVSVKVSGNNPSFYEAAGTGSTVVTNGVGGGSQEFDDGQPTGILSLSGRSAVAISATGGLVNVFGASAATVRYGMTTGAYNLSLRQSDSVLWAAGQSAVGSGIRVHRVEMI